MKIVINHDAGLNPLNNTKNIGSLKIGDFFIFKHDIEIHTKGTFDDILAKLEREAIPLNIHLGKRTGDNYYVNVLNCTRSDIIFTHADTQVLEVLPSIVISENSLMNL